MTTTLPRERTGTERAIYRVTFLYRKDADAQRRSQGTACVLAVDLVEAIGKAQEYAAQQQWPEFHVFSIAHAGWLLADGGWKSFRY